MVISPLVLILVTSIVLIAVKWWFSVSGILYRDKSIPAAPGRSLLFGNMNSAGSGMYTEEGARWLRKWALSYPKIMRIRLGPYNFISTAHPKYIRAIFNDKAEKTWLYKFAIQWLGDGLLFSKGKKWFARRKLLTPSFHFDLLKSYVDVFNETTNTMVNQMRATNGKPVEIFPKALSLTLDTILRCLVHYETNCQTQYDEYAEIMYRMSAIVCSRVFNPFIYSNMLFLLTPKGRGYLKLRERFYEISRKIILDRQEAHKNNPEILKDMDNLSFLDVLLTIKYEDGTSLSLDEILEEVNVFIFEGHDTTASAISWSLFQLAQQPDHMAKCYEEIREVFDAENGDQLVSQQQINSLKHFSMCIKECLRLKSPVPYIGRHVHNNIEVEGHRIPKGTNVAVLIDVVHRLEEFWENPHEFKPQRFSQENSKGRDPYSFIPFSAGSRNCIGQNFAMTELKMTVAKIIYNFEVALHQPENVSRIYALVLKPLDLYLKFIPRESKGCIS